MSLSYTRLKLACYTANLSQAIVGNLSPVLFLTFRTLYGLTYSALGLLVLINFVTQLAVDLVFSFFSHRFRMATAVKVTPCLTAAGLLLYALTPFLFPRSIYAGLVLGTVVFSASGGFAEVLISPVIASIPARDPDREMSKLHSVYAWGVVGMILISTVVIHVFGGDCWPWLALGFLTVPAVSAVLFFGAAIPPMPTPERVSGVVPFLRNRTFWLCVCGIFCGGAAECTMAQWSSGYLEQSLGIPKLWGDVFGVAFFAVMLGLGRSLYARFGKRVEKVLFLGSIGAAGCYLTAALSPWPLFGLLACAFTGFCVSMLWPGSLIAAADRFPHGGVFLYAMMAAGGDLGASVGPQLVGLVTDAAMALPQTVSLAASLAITPDQLGLRLGMLVGMLFPLLGTVLFFRMRKKKTS